MESKDPLQIAKGVEFLYKQASLPPEDPRLVQCEKQCASLAAIPGDVSAASLTNATVIIRGNKSKPQLNGATGTITRWDPTTKLFGVAVAQPDALIALKFDNLLQALAGVVMRSKETLPGSASEGCVVGWDATSQRCLVRVTSPAHNTNTGGDGSASSAATGEISLLGPDDIILPSGTVLRIHGLTKTPRHNGKIGTILRFDVAAARYQVQCEGGPFKFNPAKVAF